MEQMILLVSCSGGFDIKEVQSYLNDGYRIVTISAPSIPQNGQNSKWLVVLERDLT